MYGTVASFDVLLQNVYRLQQERMERVPAYVTWLEGTLNVFQWEHPHMLSTEGVQKHLRDQLFHGLEKQLWDLMWYLYDSLRVMYPEPMTAAHKAEYKYEDRSGKGASVRWK